MKVPLRTAVDLAKAATKSAAGERAALAKPAATAKTVVEESAKAWGPKAAPARKAGVVKSVAAVEEQAPALPTQLDVTAPGSAAARMVGKLPPITWAPTADGAASSLVAKGFKATAQPKAGVTVFSKAGEPDVTLVKMRLADKDGYVVSVASGDKHAQLGELSFSRKHWDAFTRGYEAPMRTYNQILKRDALLGRSPLPRDGSPLHGPQDGLKHFIRLGKSLERLEQKRVNSQELFAAQESLMATLEKLKRKGKLPKHVLIIVEGVDGASKTGNGLRLSRALEDVGFQVKSKAFRAPTPEERAMGVMGRYREFANPKAVDRPTAWFSDRGYPGDHAHNPRSNLQALATDAVKFERELRDDGVLVAKFIFHPSTKASMRTFGKRQARAAIAEDLLQRRNNFTDAEIASLREAAKLKPGYGDFRSATIAKATKGRLRAVAEETEKVFPWNQIGTADRHEGKLKSTRRFERLVRDFGKEK